MVYQQLGVRSPARQLLTQGQRLISNLYYLSFEVHSHKDFASSLFPRFYYVLQRMDLYIKERKFKVRDNWQNLYSKHEVFVLAGILYVRSYD